jgi:hypothetical protein
MRGKSKNTQVLCSGEACLAQGMTGTSAGSMVFIFPAKASIPM